MAASKKLVQKQFTLLQLAEKLGNISKVCRIQKVYALNSTSTSVPFRYMA
jgi:hypothetical protein